jgi:hypothetical protein
MMLIFFRILEQSRERRSHDNYYEDGDSGADPENSIDPSNWTPTMRPASDSSSRNESHLLNSLILE